MKVYVVESDFGSYEDKSKLINGIYSRPEVAEIEAQKIRDYSEETLRKVLRIGKIFLTTNMIN